MHESILIKSVQIMTPTGLKEGDVLELYRPGETILDPDTKLVLGQTEGKTLGKCRITRVLDKNLSTAKRIEGSELEVGDQVRFLAQISKGNGQ